MAAKINIYCFNFLSEYVEERRNYIMKGFKIKDKAV